MTASRLESPAVLVEVAALLTLRELDHLRACSPGLKRAADDADAAIWMARCLQRWRREPRTTAPRSWQQRLRSQNGWIVPRGKIKTAGSQGQVLDGEVRRWLPRAGLASYGCACDALTARLLTGSSLRELQWSSYGHVAVAAAEMSAQRRPRWLGRFCGRGAGHHVV